MGRSLDEGPGDVDLTLVGRRKLRERSPREVKRVVGGAGRAETKQNAMATHQSICLSFGAWWKIEHSLSNNSVDGATVRRSGDLDVLATEGGPLGVRSSPPLVRDSDKGGRVRVVVSASCQAKARDGNKKKVNYNVRIQMPNNNPQYITNHQGFRSARSRWRVRRS